MVGAVTWKSLVNGHIEAVLNGVAEKLVDQARDLRAALSRRFVAKGKVTDGVGGGSGVRVAG